MQRSLQITSILAAALLADVGFAQPAVNPSAVGTEWISADAKKIEANFETPPDECRPGTYWWWQGSSRRDVAGDGGVTREEIVRQLKLMKEAGLGVAHIVGISQPVRPTAPDHPGWLAVGSPEWTEMVVATIEEAGKVGMKVEVSPYPNWPISGDWAPNDLSEQMLFRTRTALKGPTRFEGVVPSPKASPGDGHHSYKGFEERWRRYNRNAEPAPELAGVILSRPGEPGKVISGSGADGKHISVAVPDGEWNLDAYWRLGGFWHVVDHYSEEAIRGQLEWAIKPVLDRVPKELVGKTFQGIYCDNIEGFHDSAWTKTFLETFQRNRGYDLKPYLSILFDGESDVCLMKQVASFRREKGEELRNRLVYDYNVTAGELNQQGFFGGLTRWANDHGLASRIEAHNPARGDYIDGYGAADIPEFEAFADNLDPRTGKWLGRFAGHTYGKNVVACESFTWLTPHFRATPQDIREAVDRIFSFGANRINNHGWSYSPVSAGWPGWFFYASSNLNQNNSWFPAYRALADYKARMSMLLRAGRPAVDVCFYGDYVMFFSGDQPVGLADAGLKDRIEDAPGATKPSGLYDRISDKVLCQRMEVKDGKWIAGLGEYSLLVLRPETQTMPLESLKKLEELVKAGGKVAALRLPEKVPGFLNHETKEDEMKDLVSQLFPDHPGLEPREIGRGRTWLLTPEMLPELIENLGLQPAVDGAGLDFVHRKGTDFDIFYLYNPGTENIHDSIRFRATGRPELWDAKTGEIHSLSAKSENSATSITLEIPAKAARVVVFRRDDSNPAPPLSEAPNQTLVRIDGPWKVRFAHIDGRPEVQLALENLVDWRSLPGFEHFSGTGTYRKSLDLSLPAPRGDVFLDLGEVCDAASVTLNGVRFGTVFEPPYRIRVPEGVLREGQNEIEVAVFNRMENAIIPIWESNEEMRKLEKQLQSTFLKKYWTWNGLVSHPSGLLGPVQILVQKQPNTTANHPTP